MIYKNVELFNVEEAEEFDGGVILQRFTKSACEDVRGRGSWMVSAAMGCEVRFVTESDMFWITFGALDDDVTVYASFGDYSYEKYLIKAGQRTTLKFENRDFFDGFDEALMSKFEDRFSHNVWRFYFHSEAPVVFYGLRTMHKEARPLKSDEAPKIKMLAYGSSITHWCYAMDSRNSYIQQVARRLNMDVFNKGMAGACRLEKSMADYLISKDDWDIAFFELGINVLNAYTVEEFKEKAEYLVKGICEKNPEKPVFLTGFYYSGNNLTGFNQKLDDFEEVLKSIKVKYDFKNLHYINGIDIMDSAEYLCRDFGHPSDYGHIRMGENLSKIISGILER